jgi:UDP-N-acetylglucosamine 2-epimerase (non-hydrolysing)
VLRETTERPEAIAAGTAKLVGTEPDTVVNAARELLSSLTAYQQMANAINPFGDGKASDRIVKIVSHYFRI